MKCEIRTVRSLPSKVKNKAQQYSTRKESQKIKVRADGIGMLHVCVIPILQSLRWEDSGQLRVSLSYIARPCLRKKIKIKNQKIKVKKRKQSL